MIQPLVEYDVSNTVSLPTFAPLPSGGVVSLRLENAGQAPLPSGIATFGQVFQQGDVPAGSGIAATAGGRATSIQMDVKSTYADGSVKFAVLSVERPDLAAGTAVDLVLSTAAKTSAPGIDLASALRGHEFTVDIVAGSGTTQVDVVEALTAALADGSATVWQQGSLAAQARVEVMLAGSQRLVFDVTAFKGGGFEVEAQFNNDRAMEAVGGRVAYTAVVTMDGRQVANQSLNQAQYQNWHETFSSNGRDGGQGLGSPASGWLNIQQDATYLEATGAVPPYDFDLGVTTSKLNEWFTATQQDSWDDPFGANGLTQYMPMTGGRAEIGITTSANTAWVMTQDARAASYAMGQAEAANGIPWHFWDATNDTWLSTENYARLWLDARGGTGRPGDATSTGLTQQVPNDTGWTPETAHQPNLSFIPYLQTGERWLLDNLNAQASWVVMATYPASRQNETDLLASGGQVRAAAWSLREVQEAAFANPDGSTESLFFSSVADTNWAWLVSKIPEWTARQGEAHGWLPGNYRDAGATAAWQQDYFASVAIVAARQGNADARTFLEWQSNFLIGRFNAEDEGFLASDGIAYRLAVFDATSGVWYTTWEEVGAAMTARGWSSGGEFLSEDYTQLALATLAGIYEITGSPAAAKAFWKVASAAPIFSSDAAYLNRPNNAYTPPPKDGVVDGPDPQDIVPGGGGSDTLTGGGPGDTVPSPDDEGPTDVPPGNQNLTGTGANDTLVGGLGNDTLNGGLGADSLIGGAGNDLYFVDVGGDVVVEAADGGADSVVASVSWTLSANTEHLVLLGNADLTGSGNDLNNWIEGNGGNNVLNGGAGNDTLIGGGGNDTLNGIPGIDSMVGGAGDDFYRVDDGFDAVIENVGCGNDRVLATTDYTLAANVEDLVIGSGGGYSGTGNGLNNVINGNDVANLIAGMNGDDTLNGGGGADTLLGGDGADRLTGGLGNDSLVGGGGDDVYYVDDAGDRTVEVAGGGNDLVIASVSYTLGDHFERLALTGTGALSGTGNALANVVTGTTAANLISGLGGNDMLNGGDGSDTLYGGDGADTMLGGNGDDRLTGGLGVDSMVGGGGNDVYYVDHTGDRSVEAAGGGTDLVIASASYTLGSEVERLTLTTAGGVAGTGNALDNNITGNQLNNVLSGLDGHDLIYGLAGADTLLGGSGNDKILGHDGNDVLVGGAGNDILGGGAGADAFHFTGANAGWDRISDFSAGIDRIELVRSGFGGTLPLGVLSNNAFGYGSQATTAEQQFLYDRSSGTLRWDGDGNGGGQSVVVAMLSGTPVLQASDLRIVNPLSVEPSDGFGLI
jgi:Ca2+-binding RTX toxin-like protein